jgi:hypothetical protein
MRRARRKTRRSQVPHGRRTASCHVLDKLCKVRVNHGETLLKIPVGPSIRVLNMRPERPRPDPQQAGRYPITDPLPNPGPVRWFEENDQIPVCESG